jgi:hypothetical protein
MELFELPRLITEAVWPLVSFMSLVGASMGQVLQFSRRNQGFDAAATAALIAAYESAVAAIARSGQPHDLCEVAARRIIAMASKGEREPGSTMRGRARDGSQIRPAAVRPSGAALSAPDPD